MKLLAWVFRLFVFLILLLFAMSNTELATVRLQNMVEVLGHWRTYVPRDDFITQRGGTFLLEDDDTLLYRHRDRGILGFSSTMNRPLAFLEPFLGD